jgi:methionyl-tRNA formyltransferase
MQKIVIISKNTEWTRKLVNELELDTQRGFFDVRWHTGIYEDLLETLDPDWIFFFHWSHIVDKSIYEKYKCVVIHTGILPKYRGGSPIQNQIIEGVSISDVNLLTMEEEVDSGDIYCKEHVSLQGNLSDIWLSISDVAAKLISKCVIENLEPRPNTTKSTNVYKRRKKQPIEFDNTKDIHYIYNQIRMMDAQGYPMSYITIGDYKLEFSRAKLENEVIISDVRISKK